MTDFFFDTSGLIKRYVTETGSVWVRSVVSKSAGHSVSITQITRAEITSAVSRRVREGFLTQRQAQAIRLLLYRHTKREYQVIGVSDDVIELAQDLLEKHPLRAADAIQLASALIINRQLTANTLPALTFVSADKRLLAVAAAESLPIHEPV